MRRPTLIRAILPNVCMWSRTAFWSAYARTYLSVAALHRDIGRSKYTVHALHASHISSRRWRCRGRHEKRKKNIGLTASAKPGEEEAWGQSSSVEAERGRKYEPTLLSPRRVHVTPSCVPAGRTLWPLFGLWDRLLYLAVSLWLCTSPS